jgi:hypothetical protein
MTSEHSQGIVYAMRSGLHGPFKIGYTTDLQERQKALQTAHAERLMFVAWVEGDQKTERALHRHLSDHHMRGEWFYPTPFVCRAVENLRVIAALVSGEPPYGASHADLAKLAELYAKPSNSTPDVGLLLRFWASELEAQSQGQLVSAA